MSNPDRHLHRGPAHAVRALLLVGVLAVTALLWSAQVAPAAKLRVTVTPETVAPGGSVTVKITGTRSRSCRISVRMDKRGALAKVRRRVRSRNTTLTIGASATPGRRVVVARCGGRRASKRLTVTAPQSGASTPVADKEDTKDEELYGDLPVDSAVIDTLQAGVGVGGASFGTMVPLSKGSRVRLSQGQGGGYSHFRASTRNAVDLALGAGTPVLAGFSGVVVGAAGGCAPTGSWGCNSGWGNFVLLKHADATCSISAHLTTITVAVGQQIGRAAQIGTVGSSGSSTGAHLHYDRMDCRSRISLPWRFEEAGPMAEGAWFTSANEPAPAVAPSPPSVPPASAARRVITVDNRVTNGMAAREDSTPVRLTTQPWTYCGRRGCNINGTERGSGGAYDAAVCQRSGERTTNGNDGDPADDANPIRFESTRYYGVRLADGTFGFVSEVWIRAADRGGLGLPSC